MIKNKFIKTILCTILDIIVTFSIICFAVFILLFPFTPFIITVLTGNAWWLLGAIFTIPVSALFLSVRERE